MKKEREEKNKEEYNFFALDKGYDANRFQIGPRVSADENNRRESHRFLYIFVSIGLILLLVSGFFIVNNSKETKTEGIGYVISNFGETSKGVIVKAVDFIMDSFSKITGNIIYRTQALSQCGDGVVNYTNISEIILEAENNSYCIAVGDWENITSGLGYYGDGYYGKYYLSDYNNSANPEFYVVCNQIGRAHV